MTGYLAALLLTVGVETPLYALALRRLLGERGRRRYLVAAAVNLSSHPLTWLVLYPLVDDLVVVELFAVVWEAAWLWAWLRREPAVLAAVSLVVNGLSLGLGVLL